MGTAPIPGSDAIAVELLPQGMAVVDPDLEDEVRRYRWHLDTRTLNRPRAFMYYRKGGGSRRLYLERLVTAAPKGKFVRFLNRNTLDCRRANLAVVNLRRDTFHLDWVQRREWEIEEIASGVINPQRRREDAWRLWCEGDVADDFDTPPSTAINQHIKHHPARTRSPCEDAAVGQPGGGDNQPKGNAPSGGWSSDRHKKI